MVRHCKQRKVQLDYFVLIFCDDVNAGVVSAIVDENLQSIRDTGQLLKDTVAKTPITEVC